MTKRAKKKAGPKAGGSLVRQPHGGAIHQGAPANPVAGSGRPPSAIREHLRGTFADRIQILEKIADGEVIQKTHVPLLKLLPHARCPKCGGGLKLAEGIDAIDAMSINIEATVSALPKDRLAALKIAAEFGLTDDMQDVLERLRKQVSLISSKPAWGSNELLAALNDQVWA